jgi:glycosyltransferase involved in cell wall biosynthesis
MNSPKIKEVTVFTAGDSQKKSTWSSLPYNLTENLLSRGIQVNRVDISESENAKWWFDRTIRRVARRIYPKTTYEYYRSLGHFWRTRQKIKTALTCYPHADANLFLTFSHSSMGLSDKPSILLCDWTHHYNITHFLGREPDFFELGSIKREDKVINRAGLVVSTFPDVTEYMTARYQNANVCYFGKGFWQMKTPVQSEIMPQKLMSKDILFIGNTRYREGAGSLISAYQKVKNDLPGIQLHIVGMRSEEFPNCPEGVHFYGFLNKDIPEQEELYYSLLKRARVFVNTTPKLGSIGAMIESMQFFTPVIAVPEKYMLSYFGERIEFGHYCMDINPAI